MTNDNDLHDDFDHDRVAFGDPFDEAVLALDEQQRIGAGAADADVADAADDDDGIDDDETVDAGEFDALSTDEVIEKLAEGDITATQTSELYRDRNAQLATQRLAVKDKLDTLELIDPAERTMAQRRDHGRLSRELDRLTTEMVQLNFGLVRRYVKKFTGKATRDDAQEYEQAGLLGLMTAIDTFDPTRSRFSGWAFRRIQREVLQAVRAVDHANMNMTDFEVQHKVRAAKNAFEKEFGEAPLDVEWVAKRAEVTVKQAKRVLDKYTLVSSDMPVSDDGSATIGDLIVEPESDVANEVIAAISQDALERHALPLLAPQELYVLIRYEGMDAEPAEGFQQIGESLGLSREAVRQAYLRAMAKLKHPRVLKACMRHMGG